MHAADALTSGRLLIADGAIETRIVYEFGGELPEPLQSSALIGDPVLLQICEGYVRVARDAGVPVIVGTPTFRADPDRAGAAGADVDALNAAAVAMQRDVLARVGYDDALIAGVIGPRGDAYRPAEAPAAEEAARYHAVQAGALARAGADFLYAPTFPAAEEAVGVARAMAATGLPYVCSYIAGSDGALLDGAALSATITRIDAAVDPPPVFHSLSCMHPSTVAAAFEADPALAALAGDRLRELKANGSARPPAELAALGRLDSDDPARFADAMWALHERYGLTVLGGCCGTDDRHMAALASRMSA